VGSCPETDSFGVDNPRAGADDHPPTSPEPSLAVDDLFAKDDGAAFGGGEDDEDCGGGKEDTWTLKWNTHPKLYTLSSCMTWPEFCAFLRIAPENAELWYRVEEESECILQEEDEFFRMMALVQVSSSKLATVREARADEYESP
jgi:hypothetical protein